ncbi:hypothetical protein GGG16DRAFT_106951 [Schizophyllum commune]
MSASDSGTRYSDEEDALVDELASNRSSSGDIEGACFPGVHGRFFDAEDSCSDVVVSPHRDASRLIIRLPARRHPSPNHIPRAPSHSPPALDPLSVEGIARGLTPTSSDVELTPIRAWARRAPSPSHRLGKRARSPGSPLQEFSDDDNPFLLPTRRTLFDVDGPSRKEVTAPKRKRGRPRKDTSTQAADAPLAVERLNPSIDLWAVVDFPPIEEKVGRGKKVKTTKVPPRKFGPAKISTAISFDQFKAILATVVKSSTTRLQLSTFSFCLEKAKRSSAYPMTDAAQYESMMKRVQQVPPKDRSATMLLILMSPPLPPEVEEDLPEWADGFRAPRAGNMPASSTMSSALGNLVGSAKNVDEKLDIYAMQLKSRWPKEACVLHKASHCYRRTEGGAEVHFVLDPARLSVWAVRLKRDPRKVTVDIPPENAYFETVRATAVVPLMAQASLPIAATPYGAPPATIPAGVGPPPPPPPPHTPYAAPPYAGYYAPPPPPSGYYPSPYAAPPHAPSSHRHRPPSPVSSPPPPSMELNEFCKQYMMSDRVHQALDEAHFRIGQKLSDQYTHSDLPPLTLFEFNDFKAAYKRYRIQAHGAEH